MTRHAATLSMLLATLVLINGCEESPAPTPPATAAPAPQRPASAWREGATSASVAVTAEEDDAELQAAIARARSTADAARERWRGADDADRARWAVKWAAPTLDGDVEHVWVVPVEWSRFRVEGVLANTPHRPLLGDHAEGDLVSLPVTELSDWMHETETGREGGFTVDVLEERFGEATGRPSD